MLPRKIYKLLMSGAVARAIITAVPDSMCPCNRCSFVAARSKSTIRPSLNSEAIPEEGDDEETDISGKKKQSKSTKTAAYLTANQPLNEAIKTYRHHLTTARTAPPEMYVIFETLAEDIAKHMNLSADSTSIYMEANPGLGLLTKLAMEQGVQKARVFEGNPVFRKRLEGMQKDYGGDRFEFVCPFNIIEFRQRVKFKKEVEGAQSFLYPGPDYLPKDHTPPKPENWETRIERMISSGLPRRPWTDATPALKFFGIIPERSDSQFIKRLVNSVAKQNTFCTVGRPEFYLILTPAQHQSLITEPSPSMSFRFYRASSVAMQTFFDVESLNDVPRNKLVPPLSKSKSPDIWKLVRLTARRNLPELMDWSMLPEYVFFLGQAMTNRKRPLLAWLDGWIPGCARRLLDIGYTMYLRTGDVTAFQYLEIFNVIYCAPEYLNSNLKIAFAATGGRFTIDVADGEEDMDAE